MHAGASLLILFTVAAAMAMWNVHAAALIAWCMLAMLLVLSVVSPVLGNTGDGGAGAVPPSPSTETSSLLVPVL